MAGNYIKDPSARIPGCMQDFALFSRCLRTLAFDRLPGLASQLDMAPAHRHTDIQSLGAGRSPVQSAVLLLIYPSESNKPTVVFIQRPEYDGAHSGQISFPGGRYEVGDHDLETTALRETYEEIGVLPTMVQICGKMTDLYIPPSNFVVSPYVGIVDHRPHFVIDKNEVTHVIEVDIETFFDPATRQMRRIQLRTGMQISTPCYWVSGHMIWGATAMMLSEFITMLSLNQ